VLGRWVRPQHTCASAEPPAWWRVVAIAPRRRIPGAPPRVSASTFRAPEASHRWSRSVTTRHARRTTTDPRDHDDRSRANGIPEVSGGLHAPDMFPAAWIPWAGPFRASGSGSRRTSSSPAGMPVTPPIEDCREDPMRIAISTGGGDAPGLNSVIRSVTLAALRRDWEVIGIRDGFNGLMFPEDYPESGAPSPSPGSSCGASVTSGDGARQYQPG